MLSGGIRKSLNRVGNNEKTIYHEKDNLLDFGGIPNGFGMLKSGRCFSGKSG